MSDIVSTIPVPCDSKSCPVAFHLEHYWLNDDGPYTVCDSDGNHEECEKSDVPTEEQEYAAWRAYWQHVARTGDDCLGEINVPRDRRFQTWQARVSNSVLGVVASVRKDSRGPWLTRREEVPPHVAAFLSLDPTKSTPVLGDFPTLDALREGARDVRWQRPRQARLFFTFRVEAPPRPVGARRIRAEARRRLARLVAPVDPNP